MAESTDVPELRALLREAKGWMVGEIVPKPDEWEHPDEYYLDLVSRMDRAVSDEDTDLVGQAGLLCRWPVHNILAHPLSEVLHWFRFRKTGTRLHDATVPLHVAGTGRG